MDSAHINTTHFKHLTQHEKDNELIHAASEGEARMVSLLLQVKADVHATSVHGETALILASSNNHISTVELLIRSGADLCKIDMYRGSALNYAVVHNHFPVMYCLFSAMSKGQVEQEAVRNPNVTKYYGNFIEAITGHRFYVLYKVFFPLIQDKSIQNIFSFLPSEVTLGILKFYCQSEIEALWYASRPLFEPIYLMNKLLEKNTPPVIPTNTEEETIEICTQLSMLSIQPSGYLPSFNNTSKKVEEKAPIENIVEGTNIKKHTFSKTF